MDVNFLVLILRVSLRSFKLGFPSIINSFPRLVRYSKGMKETFQSRKIKERDGIVAYRRAERSYSMR